MPEAVSMNCKHFLYEMRNCTVYTVTHCRGEYFLKDKLRYFLLLHKNSRHVNKWRISMYRTMRTERSREGGKSGLRPWRLRFFLRLSMPFLGKNLIPFHLSIAKLIGYTVVRCASPNILFFRWINILTERWTLRQKAIRTKFSARIIKQFRFRRSFVSSDPIHCRWFDAPLGNAR